MGSVVSACLIGIALLAGIGHTHSHIIRLRREAAICWRQIDRLLDARDHAKDEQEAIAIARKIEIARAFHNQTVAEANKCLKSPSGRLLAHMRGIRRLNAYRPQA